MRSISVELLKLVEVRNLRYEIYMEKHLHDSILKFCIKIYASKAFSQMYNYST